MVPYDMTERLKEVNRAFIEDPTPAECGRAITIRFREVIADFQSPREYYPSDSDDGYGDSSDLIYDAEDDEGGLTSLTTKVREVLADNVNVIDFLPNSTQDTNGFDVYSSFPSDCNGFHDDSVVKDYKNVGGKISQSVLEAEKSSPLEKKTDIPRLQLGSKQDDSQTAPSGDSFLVSSIGTISDSNGGGGGGGGGGLNLLKVDDSGLADLESFMKDNETEEIEGVPSKRGSPTSLSDVDPPIGTVSLIESSDKVYIDKSFSSLDNVGSGIKGSQVDNESPTSVLFHKKEQKDGPGSTYQQLPASSDADYATFDYMDDFEEFVDEDDYDDDEHEEKEEEKKKEEEEGKIKPVVKESQKEVPTTQPPPPPEKLETLKKSKTESSSGDRRDHVTERKSKQTPTKETSHKQTSQRNKHDPSSRKSPSPSTERKKRPETKTSADPQDNTVRLKSKRVPAAPPTIKPALLSSDKLNSMKAHDTSRYRNRPTSSSRLAGGSGTPTASPSLSASSSPSSTSSSSSSFSSSGSLRSRSHTVINGPVRPTQHKSSTNGRSSGTSRGASGSPVRSSASPTHQGLALSSINPTPPATTASGRPAPPYRVRKAASASDLHSSTRIMDEPDDRKRQSEAVFRAWLQQKNKQAVIAKKQQRKNSADRSKSEITERRARAEEAFQAWLARKRDQLRLEKRLRGDRRKLEDQSRYARTKADCEVAYKEWCRRKRDEVRSVRPNGIVPRSQSLERPWAQEKTRKLYSAYLNGH